MIRGTRKGAQAVCRGNWGLQRGMRMDEGSEEQAGLEGAAGGSEKAKARGRGSQG